MCIYFLGLASSLMTDTAETNMDINDDNQESVSASVVMMAANVHI